VKVLVSAYACEPDKGSEPGVGWNWAQQIARFHDVWIITRANNRASIESELAKNPRQNIVPCYVDLPPWLSFWKRGQSGIYLYYFLWQLLAFMYARKLHKLVNFEVVHHVTFGTVWLPTFMPFLGTNFVWGPIGGAERVPRSLRRSITPGRKIYEKVRDILVKWTFSLDPLARIAAGRACLIIARTSITRDAFRKTIQSKTRLMIETGVSNDFLDDMKARRSQTRTGNTLLMVGRMLHWKGFDLGIDAFLQVREKFPETKIVIVGTGPEEQRLRTLAGPVVKEGKVVFTGSLPRAQVLEIMGQADIFLIPSMKDAGTWVIFEAMASGLPVVCLNYAGPGEIVDDSCAIRVPIGRRDEVIGNIAASLGTLLSSQALRESMGSASIRRLRDMFLWEQKGELIKQFYEKLTTVPVAR
jgi:glycosyltransferase involved in cell wall biosynthesis